MARPLTPAQREDRAAEAYRLSLKGYGSREIGRLLDVSHTTAQAYVRAETTRRRAERPDFQQYVIDAHRQAIARCWEELDRNPTSHAAAQLLHALNSALASLTTVTGAAPPKRTEADIRHRTEASVRGLELLTTPELRALQLLCNKAAGRMGPEVDVLELIVERYRAGELGDENNVVVELVPIEEAESVDVP